MSVNYNATNFRERQPSIDEKNTRSRRRKDFFMKWLFTIVCGAIALIPTWFWLFMKSVLNPEGFWQNFVVYGAGIFFLGFFQITLIVGYIGLLITVIWD